MPSASMPGPDIAQKGDECFLKLVIPFQRTRRRKTCKIKVYKNALVFLLPLVTRGFTYEASITDTCQVDFPFEFDKWRAVRARVWEFDCQEQIRSHGLSVVREGYAVSSCEGG